MICKIKINKSHLPNHQPDFHFIGFIGFIQLSASRTRCLPHSSIRTAGRWQPGKAALCQTLLGMVCDCVKILLEIPHVYFGLLGKTSLKHGFPNDM
jgi:hypothetical protein